MFLVAERYHAGPRPDNPDLRRIEHRNRVMASSRVSGKPVDSSTRLVLGLCQEIEETCADIYSYYAELFAADPILKVLWEKMAAEEHNHARIIGMGMRCQGVAIQDKHYDMQKFRRGAKLIRDILTGLKATRPDAETALRSAINLEKRLLEFHLDHVVDFIDPQQRTFFRKLSYGDQQHVAQLEDAYALLQAGKRSTLD